MASGDRDPRRSIASVAFSSLAEFFRDLSGEREGAMRQVLPAGVVNVNHGEVLADLVGDVAEGYPLAHELATFLREFLADLLLAGGALADQDHRLGFLEPFGQRLEAHGGLGTIRTRPDQSFQAGLALRAGRVRPAIVDVERFRPALLFLEHGPEVQADAPEPLLSTVERALGHGPV